MKPKKKKVTKKEKEKKLLKELENVEVESEEARDIFKKLISLKTVWENEYKLQLFGWYDANFAGLCDETLELDEQLNSSMFKDTHDKFWLAIYKRRLVRENIAFLNNCEYCCQETKSLKSREKQLTKEIQGYPEYDPDIDF